MGGGLGGAHTALEFGERGFVSPGDSVRNHGSQSGVSPVPLQPHPLHDLSEIRTIWKSPASQLVAAASWSAVGAGAGAHTALAPCDRKRPTVASLGGLAESGGPHSALLPVGSQAALPWAPPAPASFLRGGWNMKASATAPITEAIIGTRNNPRKFTTLSWVKTFSSR